FGFDQGQVQRYLTAKNIKNIKKGGIMSSIAMQLIYWFCMFLGVVLFVFYKTNPSTLDFGNSNLIMTDFLLNYVPTGLLGILLAATFAAAMSSIDSILNSLTAVFTKDIYEPYITKKKDTPLSTTIMFSVIFGVIIVGFVYAGLSGN
ncbi:sodium:solute symporter family transporter, partial [Clostridium sediminicola]